MSAVVPFSCCLQDSLREQQSLYRGNRLLRRFWTRLTRPPIMRFGTRFIHHEEQQPFPRQKMEWCYASFQGMFSSTSKLDFGYTFWSVFIFTLSTSNSTDWCGCQLKLNFETDAKLALKKWKDLSLYFTGMNSRLTLKLKIEFQSVTEKDQTNSLKSIFNYDINRTRHMQ